LTHFEYFSIYGLRFALIDWKNHKCNCN